MTGELGTRKSEVRRLTFVYCDVVGSTALSGRLELETYHELMRAYRTACRDVIEARFEGHIVHFQGDGLLAAFGFPLAHENDAERAVRAGLALVRAVRDLSLEVRIAVHRGPVFVDFGDDDISGLPANVGSRFEAAADPGTVVVSEEVRRLVADHFEIEAGEPQLVKGVDIPIQPFRIMGERPAPARRSWSTPLVERESELERLTQAYAHTASGSAGSPTGILVHGEAGVGKTRLVAALVDQAANGPVVDLHGSPFHREVGFHPVRRLIEARCNIGDDDSPAVRLECLTHDVTGLGLDPAATVPLLAPVAGVDPRAGYEQAPAVGRLLEEQVTQAVLDYTSACLEGRPGIVVAENLHWFDPATRALLEKLLRVGAGTVLIVATSRNPEPGPWEAIELRPLSVAGRHALLDALEQDLTDEDRLALATRSGGIPLYLEELVRAGDRDQRTAGAAAPVPGSVPEVLYEPLVARLYATPSAIPVAATAAAAGQEVDRSLLAATMPDMTPSSLDSTLAALVDARILEAVQGRSERYQFRHELLREVAYELQPPSWRREVHSRLCDLLVEDESRDWQVLASHFERAERPSEAAAAYQETAELARRRGALAEARGHLTRAIDLVLPLAADAARDHQEVQLRLRRGFLAMSMEGAGSAQASADFNRCRELAESDPHGDDMLSTLISLWAYYLSHGELDRAREVTTTLRGTIGDQPETLRPTNPAGAGMLDWFAGDFTSSIEQLTTAVDALDKMPGGGGVEAVWFVPNNPFVAMHVHLALARFMAGDTEGADQSLARARRIASSLDFPQGPWSAAYAIWLGSWTWIEAGRLEPAEQSLAELQSLCVRHGLDSWGLIAATQTAALEAFRALRGGSDAASLLDCAELLGSLLDIWQAVELRVFLPFYLTTTGALLAAAGDAEAARGRYEESLALSTETGMRFYDAETLRRLGRLESALELARAQGARVFEERIELDLRALSGHEARSLR